MNSQQDNFVFQIYHNREFTVQLDEGMNLFFGLHGQCHIVCANQTYTIEPAGIVVINPYDVYQLQCPNDASILCVKISESILRRSGWNNQKCKLYARNAEQETGSEHRVRVLFADAFQSYFQDGQQKAVSLHSPEMQLVHLLLTDFSEDTPVSLQRKPSMQRLKRILDFIHIHWNEELLLSEIAKQEFMSVSYLSRFFQKSIGISFSQYIKRIRLSHATEMLIHSNESITHIAYACGFGTPSVFVEAFKQQYHQTPGQYRQAEKQTSMDVSFSKQELQRDTSALLAYMTTKQTATLTTHVEQIDIVCQSKSERPVSWRRILNIGYARDGLLAPIQEQIRRAQSEIGFEYIRFHGIFDADMHIYKEENGTLYFHFYYVDLLFDFILSQHLTPYIELSFMPTELAREQTKIFDRPSIISGCIDLPKWSALVQATISHFIARYGRQEVLHWKFSTISQSYVHLNCVLWEDYQALYAATWKTIKAIDPALCFGGPGCFAELVTKSEGMDAFLSFAQQNQCLPDFLAFQFNPNIHNDDPLFMDFTLSQQATPAILTDDPDFLTHTLDILHDLMRKYHCTNREIVLDECTPTLWQRDLSSDTCYKAVWLVKNVCDSAEQAVFGHWLLTDLLEERADIESVYHGGYGLLTYNGIPKAGYHALRLLHHMGDQIIQCAPGWMLTRQQQTYQLIAYNYCYYSKLYRYRYQRLEKPEDAYRVFEPGEVKQLQFHLYAIPDGWYRVTYQKITKKDGSSFDRWIEMGAPGELQPEQTRYLMESTQPYYRTERLKAKDGIHLEVLLQPLETELITLTKLDIPTEQKT